LEINGESGAVEKVADNLPTLNLNKTGLVNFLDFCILADNRLWNE
jgi:hypothetical protein